MLGLEHAQVTDEVAVLVQHIAALAVELVVLQVAQHARPVDLGRHKRGLHLFSRAAQVDRGFLANLHLAQHVGDPVLLVEKARASRAASPVRSGPRGR